MNSTKKYWESIYENKTEKEVSWTQKVPTTSLQFIHSFHLSKSASIIDIGAGDSRLVDFLLDEGFTNITVLDISSVALKKAKDRLGKRASQVKWIESDVVSFKPVEKYDVWHDRAAFHFLTREEDIHIYVSTAMKSVKGYLISGTFSETGPPKCSGLEIVQYSEEKLADELKKGFEKIRCLHEDHQTPFGTIQNFLFCSFKRKQAGHHS